MFDGSAKKYGKIPTAFSKYILRERPEDQIEDESNEEILIEEMRRETEALDLQEHEDDLTEIIIAFGSSQWTTGIVEIAKIIIVNRSKTVVDFAQPLT